MNNHLNIKQKNKPSSFAAGHSTMPGRATRVDYSRSERVNTWIRFRLSLDRGSVFGVPQFGFDWLGFQGKRASLANIRTLEDAVADDLRIYKSFFSVTSVSIQPLNSEGGIESLRISIEYNFADDSETHQCLFDYVPASSSSET